MRLAREYGALLRRELSLEEQEILRQAVRGTYAHCAARYLTPCGAELLGFLSAWVAAQHGSSTYRAQNTGPARPALQSLQREIEAIAAVFSSASAGQRTPGG